MIQSHTYAWPLRRSGPDKREHDLPKRHRLPKHDTAVQHIEKGNRYVSPFDRLAFRGETQTAADFRKLTKLVRRRKKRILVRGVFLQNNATPHGIMIMIFAWFGDSGVRVQ